MPSSSQETVNIINISDDEEDEGLGAGGISRESSPASVASDEELLASGTFIIEEEEPSKALKSSIPPPPPDTEVRLPVHLVSLGDRSQLRTNLRAWTGLLTSAQIDLPGLSLTESQLGDLPAEVRAKMCHTGWDWHGKGGALGMIGHLLLASSPQNSQESGSSGRSEEDEELTFMSQQEPFRDAAALREEMESPLMQALVAAHGIGFALARKLARIEEGEEPGRKRKRTCSQSSLEDLRLTVELGNNSYTVDLCAGATVEQLQDKMQDLTGINWKHQRLFNSRRRPIDGLTSPLSSCGVKDGDTISLFESPCSSGGIPANACIFPRFRPTLTRTASLNTALERAASQGSLDDLHVPPPPASSGQNNNTKPFPQPPSAGTTGFAASFSLTSPPPTPPTTGSGSGAFGFRLPSSGPGGLTIQKSSPNTCRQVHVWGRFHPLPDDLRITGNSNAKYSTFKRIREGCEQRDWNTFNVKINGHTTPQAIIRAIALAAMQNHFHMAAVPALRTQDGAVLPLEEEFVKQGIPDETRILLY